jgi:hypothetical protein
MKPYIYPAIELTSIKIASETVLISSYILLSPILMMLEAISIPMRIVLFFGFFLGEYSEVMF